jgi:hypothetical protein
MRQFPQETLLCDVVQSCLVEKSGCAWPFQRQRKQDPVVNAGDELDPDIVTREQDALEDVVGCADSGAVVQCLERDQKREAVQRSELAA